MIGGPIFMGWEGGGRNLYGNHQNDASNIQTGVRYLILSKHISFHNLYKSYSHKYSK